MLISKRLPTQLVRKPLSGTRPHYCRQVSQTLPAFLFSPFALWSLGDTPEPAPFLLRHGWQPVAVRKHCRYHLCDTVAAGGVGTIRF